MIRFEIPGKPFGKQRHRTTKTGRTYTPKATVDFETVVGTIANMHFSAPICGPVGLTIEAIFVPAKSWTKKRRAEAMGAYHTQKPDADNISKAIKDGMNGIVYQDDSQVADLHVTKIWGHEAKTIVIVESIDRPHVVEIDIEGEIS